MARKLRLQYPGAIYHVMSRGDRREAIFTDDEDRQLFLDSLAEACAKEEARLKGDPEKLRIALRLRKETTMTLGWIAERLGMGVPSHLACLLYRQSQNQTKDAAASENTLF